MDPAHPFLVLAASVFADACAWGHDAYAQVAAEASAFMLQPLHRSIPPVLVAVLVSGSLWKAMRITAPAMAVSRTVTITDVDELMMQRACGCDCSQVTGISVVTVAPSPELSFEASQPQLRLDTCDAVGAVCVACARWLYVFRCIVLHHDLSVVTFGCSCSRSVWLRVTCESSWRRAILWSKGPALAPFARTCLRAACCGLCVSPDAIALHLAHTLRRSFVPAALKNNLVWFTVLGATDSTPASAIAEFASKCLLEFSKLTAATPERLKNNVCHLLLLPGVGEGGVAARVDSVQVQLQPVAVSLGLMIGEFHKSNNASGLHNSNFYPLRMPFPALAIRRMVPGDFVFLKNEKKFPAAVVAQLMRHFIQHMKGRQGAQAAIEGAQQVLAAVDRGGSD